MTNSTKFSNVAIIIPDEANNPKSVFVEVEIEDHLTRQKHFKMKLPGCAYDEDDLSIDDMQRYDSLQKSFLPPNVDDNKFGQIAVATVVGKGPGCYVFDLFGTLPHPYAVTEDYFQSYIKLVRTTKAPIKFLSCVVSRVNTNAIA